MCRTILFFFVSSLLCCCRSGTHERVQFVRSVEVVSATADTIGSSLDHDPSSDLQPFEVVIVDTGHDHREMAARMLILAKALDLDTTALGRQYYASRDSLLIPFDSEDELYRGVYVPRRFPGPELSLEYLSAYSTSGPGTFALVAGIWEQRSTADSMLAVVRAHAPTAFRVRSDLYVGCMH